MKQRLLTVLKAVIGMATLPIWIIPSCIAWIITGKYGIDYFMNYCLGDIVGKLNDN